MMNNYIKKIKKEINKIGIKKILVIGVSIIVVLVLLNVISKLIEKKLYENKIKDNQYESVSDFKTVREVLVYMGCDYIKETGSKDKNYSRDIYLKFNKDLYDNDESNQQFFENLIIYTANVLKFSNFRMIDNSKNITIEIMCDKDNLQVTSMIINGKAHYFEEMDSKIQLKKFKEDKEINLDVNANNLKKIINNEWYGNAVEFGSKESTYNKYDIYFEEGIEVRTTAKKIFNIVFTKNYVGEIVNNIKVGDSFSQIESKLGQPSFEEDEIIGYKSKDMYIFFENDEISIYRNDKETSEEFTRFLNENLNAVQTKKIASELTDIWSDYNEYSIDEDDIYLEYALKGVKLEYNSADTTGITLYKNFIGNIVENKTIENIDENEIPQNVNINTEEDLVFISEKNRKAQKDEEEYIAQMQVSGQNEFDYNIKSEKVNYYIKYENEEEIIRFFSKDNEFAKSELEEKINSYMWIGDYQFLYSIKGQGIYIYNPQTRQTVTVKEGKQDYTFKKYENGIIEYDNNKIKIN